MDLLRSLPIGLYLEKPFTWLHRLDPRIKLAWLMSFLLTPILANAFFRLGLVVLLFLIILGGQIPLRVAKQSNWLLMVAFLTFLIALFSPDGLGVISQPRLPTVPLNLPQPTDYQYVLFSQGWFTITRNSLDLAIRASSLLFTLIFSTNLYLLTTAPEEITAALEKLMQPWRRFNLPITEIVLTLTLSLRFIPLVLEEIQNLVRSVRTRAINWSKLGMRNTYQLWVIIIQKVLENLLLRAEQTAVAMEVRGFTSPNRHRVQWHRLSFGAADWVATLLLLGLWGVRLIYGGDLQ